jgi:hypothetical protein
LTLLHQHLLQYIQKNRELPERLARSPRAIKTIKDLEAAIAIFPPVKLTPEYEVSEYATRNKCLRCNPAQHLGPIQDQLLLHDIQTRQEKNWVRKPVKSFYKINCWPSKPPACAWGPSEKLKKDPIMNLVTKTVATFMFLKNMNNPKQSNEI